MRHSMLKLVSCSLLICALVACKKGKISYMEHGIYEMTRIHTFSDENKDTVRFIVNGPFESKEQFEFRGQGANIIIYKPNKKSKTYGSLKVILNLYPYSDPNFYQNHVSARIDTYEIDKKQLFIRYRISKDDPAIERSIQLKWFVE